MRSSPLHPTSPHPAPLSLSCPLSPPSWPLLWGGSLGVSFLFCSPLSNAIFSLSTFDFQWVVRCTPTDKRCGGTEERRKKNNNTQHGVYLGSSSLLDKRQQFFFISFLFPPRSLCINQYSHQTWPLPAEITTRSHPTSKLLKEASLLLGQRHALTRRRKLEKFFSPVKLNDVQWQAFVKDTDYGRFKKENYLWLPGGKCLEG